MSCILCVHSSDSPHAIGPSMYIQESKLMGPEVRRFSGRTKPGSKASMPMVDARPQLVWDVRSTRERIGYA